MYKKGFVVDVRDNDISVLPLLNDACSSCTQACNKRGEAYSVNNPRHLDVKKGSIVGITAQASVQAVQGIFSLLFPFLCAIAGYFCASPIASLLSLKVTEAFKAVCVLIFLFLSSAIVFVCARLIPLPGKPEIVEVY